MVLYSMKHLESERKNLIKNYEKEIDIKFINILIEKLFPNLPIGYRRYEEEKERLIISRRATFIKQYTKLYHHAKQRKRYNFVHFNCGLGQKLPQSATRIISNFITCPLKTGTITKSLFSEFYHPNDTNTTSYHPH